MKTTLTFLLLLFSVHSFAQSQESENGAIEKLNARIDTLVMDEGSVYELKKDIIGNSKEIQKIKMDLDKSYTDFITTWSGVIFAIITAACGILSFIGIQIYFKKIAKSYIIQKIDSITKVKFELLDKEFKEIQKHNDLRLKSKIIIINKLSTEFPDGLIKVLKLYDTDPNNSRNKIEVEELKEILSDTYISKLKSADLVIIENQVPEKIWGIGENSSHYVELANKICGSTALVYYGSGQFPTGSINPSLQHMVTYANAPSQLYGNIMNMLKFKSELDGNHI